MDTESRIKQAARESWIVGDNCKIFSYSANKWFNGEIVKIFNDREGEWLDVRYGYRVKSTQRFSECIKPLSTQLMKPKGNIKLKYTDFKTIHEYAIFGYLRGLSSQQQQHHDSTDDRLNLWDLNVIVLCLKFYVDDAPKMDIWSTVFTDQSLNITENGTLLSGTRMHRATFSRRCGGFGAQSGEIKNVPSGAYSPGMCQYVNGFGSDIISKGRIRTWGLRIKNKSCETWDRLLNITIGICSVDKFKYNDNNKDNIMMIKGEFTNYKNEGYGLCDDGNLYHGSSINYKKYYNQRLKHKDEIIVHLDLIKGKLLYTINGRFVGIAYNDIDITKDYVLAVAINCIATTVELFGEEQEEDDDNDEINE